MLGLLWQQICRGVERQADQEVAQCAEVEIAPCSGSVLVSPTIMNAWQHDAGEQAQPDDEGRAELVVDIPFVQHCLQGNETDCPEPVPVPQQTEPHRRSGQTVKQCAEHHGYLGQGWCRISPSRRAPLAERLYSAAASPHVIKHPCAVWERAHIGCVKGVSSCTIFEFSLLLPQ